MVILLDLDMSSTSPSEDGVVMLQQLRQARAYRKNYRVYSDDGRSLYVQAIQHGARDLDRRSI